MIARPNFRNLDSDAVDTTIELPGKIEQVVLCAYANMDPHKISDYFENIDSEEVVNPFPGEVHMTKDLYGFGEVIEGDSFDYIKFHRIPSGFVAVIRTTSGNEDIQRHETIDTKAKSLLEMAEFKNIDLPTLNYALYK